MRLYTAFFVSVGMASIAVSANGQVAGTADTDAADRVDGDIVVTAQKRAERAQEIPASITAVDGGMVAALHLDTAIDVLKLAPNANAWGSDSRSRPRYYIRGIGNGNQSNNAAGAVSVAMDDVYLNSLMLQGFPLFDLERVEILNGPQGTLQGKNATAGSINFISRRPDFDRSGYAKATVGSFDTKELEAAFGGALISDKIAARASMRFEHTDGTSENAVDGRRGGQYDDFAARIQMLASLPNGEIILNAHYRSLNGTRVPYYFSAQNANAPLIVKDRSFFGHNLESIDDLNASGAFLRANLDLSDDISLTSISGYDRGNRTITQDVDSTPGEFSRYYEHTNDSQYSQEIRISSSADKMFSWIVGGYYLHERLRSFLSFATLSLPGVAAPSYYYTSFKQKNESTALFGSVVLKLFDKLKLQGGLRWTRDKAAINLISQRATSPVVFNNMDSWWLPASVGQALTDNARQTDSVHWSKVNYDASATWNFTRDAMIFGRIASGYRSGNFQGQVSATTAPGTVDPETLKSYEIGAKTSWFDNRLIFNVTAFHGKYNNIQISVLTSTPTGNVGSLANAAGGYSKGIETELRLKPVSRLSIVGNLGLLRTRFTSTSALGGAVRNHFFARAPRTTAFLSGDYTLPLGNAELVFGASGRYNSAFYFLSTNQTALALKQDGYVVGDLRAAIKFPRHDLEVMANVNNFTNSTYSNQVLPYSFGAFAYSLGAPRTFLLAAKAGF